MPPQLAESAPALVAAALALLVLHLLWQRLRMALRHRRAARLSVRDAANQIRFVSAAAFRRKPVMNRGEFRVFRLVEQMAREADAGHRVFAQTSLGEIIGSDDQRAFDSINSKRIDILVVDRFGLAAAAIEYQGSGHYQGNAAARDTVKREALRRAGVPYVEIADGEGDDSIRRRLADLLSVR